MFQYHGQLFFFICSIFMEKVTVFVHMRSYVNNGYCKIMSIEQKHKLSCNYIIYIDFRFVSSKNFLLMMSVSDFIKSANCFVCVV